MVEAIPPVVVYSLRRVTAGSALRLRLGVAFGDATIAVGIIRNVRASPRIEPWAVFLALLRSCDALYVIA